MIKVSILVPVYNVAEYLPECLESLQKQTLKEIEIICLNDGSIDESLKIIQNYAKDDPRFVIIDKRNSGYGDSMNKGLLKAKGEYIAIVESDDFAEAGMCKALYGVAKKHNADVVRSNYFYHTKGGDVIHESIKKQPDVADLRENHDILYEEPAIWSGIYRRDFLKKNAITFLPTPGASYQDTSFNIKSLAMANRIAYTKKAYLHYRVDNNNSSVKSKEKVEAVVKEYAEVDKYFKKKQISEEVYYAEQAAKFGAYHWNFQRLEGLLAKEFLKKIKDEFKASEKAGLIRKDFFPRRWWFVLRLILDLPLGITFVLLKTRKIIKNK